MRNITLTITALVLSLQLAVAQNNPPFGVPDTVNGVCQVPMLIDVLANDFDPDGDSIFITGVNSYSNTSHIENGMIWFLPGYYSGPQHFRYTISDGQSNMTIYSVVMAFINPDAPVAVPDTVDMVQMVPETIDLLSNDSDPNGDLVKIAGVFYASGCSVTVNPDSSTVTVTPAYTVMIPSPTELERSIIHYPTLNW